MDYKCAHISQMNCLPASALEKSELKVKVEKLVFSILIMRFVGLYCNNYKIITTIFFMSQHYLFSEQSSENFE